MAQETYFRPHLTFNGIDISADYIESLTVNRGRRLEPTTAMGDDATGQDATLSTFSMEVAGFHGIEASEPDDVFGDVMFELAGTATGTFRPKADAVGASNPQESGVMAVTGYSIDLEVGAKGKFSASLVAAGTIATTVA